MTGHPVNGPDPTRPVGAVAVRAAVLEAAAARFAAEGADASLRDIADDAGVNLGLIHRHLGNKDDLLRAVLANEVARGLDTIAEAEDVADAMTRMFAGGGGGGESRYVRIVAWLLLRDPEGFRHQDTFPGMRLLRALPDPDPDRQTDPRPDRRADAEVDRRTDADRAADRDARLVLAMAALFGWTVFGPQLRAAFGVEAGGDDDLRRRMEVALTELVAPPAARGSMG